ncbi:follitropin subunit beta-like [Oreochromis niloticus]|uniref:follitropin subunit beta-like n=1 Tax=Oreochromis niloticus TaxID=8128 RepID=UPI000393D5A5|nr:follitropin subunit beta-like [Oreochromis niloticus]
MPLSALKSLLLCALMVGAVYTCMLKNYTLWIEKQDCTQCVAINTTICSGYCYTQDTNLKGRFGRTFLIQRSCVPLSLVYQAAHIPGCPKDVNPQLYYPAAHCCSCRRCDTRTHRCVRTSRIPYDQCFTTLDSVKKQNQSALEISQYSNTSGSALARK